MPCPPTVNWAPMPVSVARRWEPARKTVSDRASIFKFRSISKYRAPLGGGFLETLRVQKSPNPRRATDTRQILGSPKQIQIWPHPPGDEKSHLQTGQEKPHRTPPLHLKKKKTSSDQTTTSVEQQSTANFLRRSSISTHMPLAGCGKTHKQSAQKPCPLFPLSRSFDRRLSRAQHDQHHVTVLVVLN